MSNTVHRKLWTSLFCPTSIAPLVQFRIALGFILLWEAYRYIAHDWPQLLHLDPSFHFKYARFDWVEPLPHDLHHTVFPLLAVLALALIVGLIYRAAALLLFIGWAYVFLIDQALYLNHLYLVLIILGLMIFLPAHRAFSFDVLWRERLRATVVPRWTIDILRFQIALVYIYGGIAKLNGDWLSGVPMQMMLLEKSRLLGQWAGEPELALLFAYGGVLLDLGIIPLLCWKRTRILGLLLAAIFHIANHLLFQIGIFPWMMLAATIILWPPRSLTLLGLGRLYGGLVLAGMIATWLTHSADLPEPAIEPWAWLLALVAAAILIFPPDAWKQLSFENPDVTTAPRFRTRPLALALLMLFASWQILMPLRHFLYPGDVSWTEQGHKWAWHMKLRVKLADRATFFIRDQQGNLLERVNPFAPNSPLTLWQAETMATRPDMVLEFAHYLRDRAQAKYHQPVKVTVNDTVSLNGRPFQRIIDPEADLASIEPRLWPPASWIEPLTTPRRQLGRVNVDQVMGRFDYIETVAPRR